MSLAQACRHFFAIFVGCFASLGDTAGSDKSQSMLRLAAIVLSVIRVVILCRR